MEVDHHPSMHPDALHRRAIRCGFGTSAVEDVRDVRTADSLLTAYQVEHVSQGHAVRRGETRILWVLHVHGCDRPLHSHE